MNFIRTAAVLSLLVGAGCGGEEGVDPVAQDAPEEANAAPAPAPEPEPLMRRPIHCCSDLVLEGALKSYLSMGSTLAAGDAAAIETDRAAMVEQLTELGADHALAEMVDVVTDMETCELEACRESFSVLSKVLVETIGDTHSGDLDIAIAWSRKHQSPWIQEGNELHSPYGDGIESYSWGLQEEVKGADKVREAERGEGVVHTPPIEEAPPVEADPPDGADAPPPEEGTDGA